MRKAFVNSSLKEKILKTCAIYGKLIFCHKKSIAKIAIIKYQISNIKLKNQKSMKGIIKERRTTYFCHFSTDFLNFSTIFQHSFQQKASFPQKSAVLRANTLYWKKYGYCWKLKFSTSAAYAQRRAFLEMRLKYFLAVYARKWTDSLNPKKFNCGGHICPKVKTPYGQKRGGGTAANRAEREHRPRKRKAKTRAFAIDKPPCNRL